MKRKAIIKSLFFLFVVCFYSVELQSSIKYSINEAWFFRKGSFDKNHLQQESKNWDVVSFPHTWNAEDAVDDTPGFYRGEAWYYKKINIPQSYQDKVVYIYFEGANQVTDIYVNGEYAGQHKGGYTRFCFDISQFLKPGGENELAIKVDNAHNIMIPPLSADFTFFGGVYRDVYLNIKDQTHISPLDFASSGVYVATPVVNRDMANIDVKVLLNNKTDQKQNITIENILITPQGEAEKTVIKKYRIDPNKENDAIKASFKVEKPSLWSIDSPNLYTVRTIIRDAKTKEVLDESLDSFGLRWFSFDADKGFFLNGEYVKLIGTNRHQCFLNKGNALEDQYHVRDVRLLKSMGGNFLRVSHYPQDPLILEMCDKFGIVASVEIPIVNAITESQEFLDNSLYMTEEMVKQNFNHPSLVMWSYMNEVMLRPPYKEKDDEYKPYCAEVNRQARAIEEHIRTLDPARYTMVALHGSIKTYEDVGMFDIPMLIGWNLYQGWYSGSFDGFDRFIKGFKEQYPNKPFMISEYGADVDSRIHSFVPERFDFSVEHGDRYHEHYLRAIKQNDFVFGATIWNLNDFHSEVRTSAVPRVNSKGITELNRVPKNTYYLYKAHLTKEPFVKIASADWFSRAGVESSVGVSTQKIKIYSNQKEVTIYHNGKKLSTLTLTDCVGEIEIPFTEGPNSIEARVTALNITDVYNTNFTLLPKKIGSEFKELNVLLGSTRFFEEKDGEIIWIPEKEYEAGSWGYIGGQAFRPKTNFGNLPAAEIDILGTDLDPLYQTQRVDIETFKADVPNGKYAIYLYWADLNKKEAGEALAYNLGNDSYYNLVENRVFDVIINSKKTIDSYDIPNEVGTERAITKKILIDVADGDGLTIDFKPIEGQSILNAIRILKTN